MIPILDFSGFLDVVKVNDDEDGFEGVIGLEDWVVAVVVVVSWQV